MRIPKSGVKPLIFFDFLIYAIFADYADTCGCMGKWWREEKGVGEENRIYIPPPSPPLYYSYRKQALRL